MTHRDARTSIPPTEPRAQPREGLICHEIDGEGIIYDNACNTTFRLNQTSYFIWAACDGVADVCAIAGRMATAFDVALDVALADVRRCIRQMLDLGLLVERACPTNSLRRARSG